MLSRGIFQRFFLAAALLAAVLIGQAAAVDVLRNDRFDLRLNLLGVTGLKCPGDAFDTEFVAPGRTLGEVTIRYRKGGGRWQDFVPGKSGERREISLTAAEAKKGFVSSVIDRYYMFHADFNDHYADLEFIQGFRLEGDALVWTIQLGNLSDENIEVGDIALATPFNSEERWDPAISHNLRVVSHSFISGHASFLFWMRPNNVGPFLVMTPISGQGGLGAGFKPAKLEYWDERGVYIHSAASGEAAERLGGNWRQPHTSLILGPKSSAASRIGYAFKFQWADGYQGVRDVLFREGLLDIQVGPGMTVPEDLEAMVSIRTRSPIRSIIPEHPARTRVEDLGSRAGGSRLYRVKFSRLGENLLTVNFGAAKSMALEFFVTESLETLIKKRAAFLAARQLHRDPSKWYNGLFSDWDMKAKVLRGPDDRDGLKDYWLASDDPGLCKAPYLAEKNVYYPEAREVEALEYHLKNFVWGKLQCTEKEKYPYGIYGIPDWKVNRESKPSDRRGWKDHLWRVYDYPHMIMLYLDMAKIAKLYPKMVKYLDRKGYLERAYGTAMSYFTVPMKTAGWDAHKIGNFNELVIVDLINELQAEGWTEKAESLRLEWEVKVRHFINGNPNVFIAEYPFGPCAFESTHALAKYAMERLPAAGSSLGVKLEDVEKFLEWQIKANITLRGWLETAYYLLGSSDPGSLFYMSQMGGWSVLDYSLYFAKDPAPTLRLGYASFLSGWSLINSGTAESNYGFWFPGPENDGGASNRYVPLAFGHMMGKAQPRGGWNYGGEADLGFGAALRSAATIVADDPLFGVIAYGGQLAASGTRFEVVPKDGLRRRFHVIKGEQKFHMEIDRDGFAEGKPISFDLPLSEIRLTVENRSSDSHETLLKLSGLPPGSYEALLDGRPLPAFESKQSAVNLVRLPMGMDSGGSVIIRLAGPGPKKMKTPRPAEDGEGRRP